LKIHASHTGTQFHNVSYHLLQLIEKETPPSSFKTEVTPRQHAVVNVAEASPPFQIPRRIVHDESEDVREPLIDHDENKYKRRTPLDWVLR